VASVGKTANYYSQECPLWRRHYALVFIVNRPAEILYAQYIQVCCILGHKFEGIHVLQTANFGMPPLYRINPRGK
jgi:hypothetical protein